jgi:hypothetical protein
MKAWSGLYVFALPTLLSIIRLLKTWLIRGLACVHLRLENIAGHSPFATFGLLARGGVVDECLFTLLSTES